jgi:hypothetical protein
MGDRWGVGWYRDRLSSPETESRIVRTNFVLLRQGEENTGSAPDHMAAHVSEAPRY